MGLNRGRPQEVVFNRLQALLTNFKQQTEALGITTHSDIKLPAPPKLPRILPIKSRLEIGLLFDGLIRYVKEEVSTLLSEKAGVAVADWIEAVSPLPFDEMPRLYGLVNLETNAMAQQIVAKAYALYDMHASMLDEYAKDTVPDLMKVSFRMSFLVACAAVLCELSTLLVRLKEGLIPL